MIFLIRVTNGDIILVLEELRRRGELDSSGGPGYLSGLVEWCPTAANVVSYARAVQEKSIRRLYLQAIQDIEGVVYNDPSSDIRDLSGIIEKRIFEVSQFARHGDFSVLKSVVGGVMNKLEEQYLKEDKSETLGIASGIRDFDTMTNGFHPGNLFFIAARPSVGKTALALGMALHMAKQYKKPIAFFSLEMTKDEIVQRLLSLESGVNLQKMRSGDISPAQFDAIKTAANLLATIPLYIDDTQGMSVGEIRSKSRRLQTEYGQLGAVYIDYIGLIHTTRSNKRDNLVQELGDNARSLKGLGGELKTPVICLAQLSRGVESREEKRPQLSDLRDSGNLEEHADGVAFIYRPDYYRKKQNFNSGGPKSDQTEMDTPEELTGEIIIGKQRNGPTGIVTVRWNPNTASYSDMDSQRDDSHLSAPSRIIVPARRNETMEQGTDPFAETSWDE